MSNYEKKEEKDDDVHTPESVPLFNPPALNDRAVTSDPEDVTRSVTHHLTHQTFISEKSQHKINMIKKYENLFEGIKLEGNQTYLNRIYTQLYIIEGKSEGVNKEHEDIQMENTTRTQHSQETPIYCNDIFKASPGPGCEEKDKIKIVLTKGIAGIGKTVSVQKFILDWAEGKGNQDVDFMFVLPFRELNLKKDHEYSLHRLLLDFHPELQNMNSQIYEKCKVVFIFDGLDESRISLEFSDSEKVSDVTKVSSVGMLISNLMKGDLLPSALIWITSRPAAANQIPSKYINRMTEILGFNDPQKEEYFRKRISDENQASRIISNLRGAGSLQIMCHIPVFCWISSTVFQRLLEKDLSAQVPQTLTEMYIYFLLTQINMRNQKYEERDPEKLLQSNREVIVKLSELAFKQLMKGNVMFCEEDLIESGLDVTDASVYSWFCTEIFKEESVIHQRKVYSFIHLSFQEFLAAFYVFYFCVIRNKKSLELFLDEKYQWYCKENFIFELLKAAINNSLQSENRHLHFFLRFLLGISLLSNQGLLLGLLRYTEDTWYSIKKTARYIKDKIKCDETLSADRSINLFLCMLDMNDMTLYQEIQEFVKSGNHSVKQLSVAYCSAIAYMLQMSEKKDEFNLKTYNTSDEGRRRLIPAVRNCRKAILAGCRLTVECFESLSSILQSPNSLRELDLSNNDLEDSGVKLLSGGFKSSTCQLNILRLTGCSLTAQCCESLSSALQSTDNSLRELDLSHNDLQDSGVKLLSDGLKSLHCHLNILRLSSCMVTEEGCGYLASALSSNHSHLKELDLSYNNPGESGVKLLSDPKYRLEKLNVDHGGDIRIVRGPQKYACDLTLDLNTAHSQLILSESNRTVTCETKKHPYPNHTERFTGYHPQVLCRESLSGRCYWEAEWSGRDKVNISVVYKGISRKDNSSNCWFGYNKNSWSLMCFEDKYIVRHNSVSTEIMIPSQFNRVGVYLNWSVGTLSFYSVSDTHTLTLLHTFNSTFNEPLYAGFGFYSDKSMSVWKIKQPLVRNN